MFVDEEAIAALNERFLGHEGPDRRALLPDRGRPRLRPGHVARTPRQRARPAWHERRDSAGSAPPARRRRHLPRGRRPQRARARRHLRRRDRPAPRARHLAPARDGPRGRGRGGRHGGARAGAARPPLPTSQSRDPSRLDPRRDQLELHGRQLRSCVAVVVLVGGSAVLALAETGLTRTSRGAGQGARGRRRRGAPRRCGASWRTRRPSSPRCCCSCCSASSWPPRSSASSRPRSSAPSASPSRPCSKSS